MGHKTDHADLLNALDTMQRSPIYALRWANLREAELLILRQEREAKELRRLLARAIAGSRLYADGGELQDNSVHPTIDFQRDSVAEIECKLAERACT